MKRIQSPREIKIIIPYSWPYRMNEDVGIGYHQIKPKLGVRLEKKSYRQFRTGLIKKMLRSIFRQ